MIGCEDLIYAQRKHAGIDRLSDAPTVTLVSTSRTFIIGAAFADE